MLSSFSHVQLFATPWTVACQAPLSTGFSRQEYWNGLPCPPPGDFPYPGIEPMSPVLKADSLLLSYREAPISPSVHFSSVAQSCPNSLQPHESQHARPPCSSPSPGVHPDLCALSWWCHPAISSSVVSSSSCPIPSQHQSLFQWVNSSHKVAKVLEFQLQHQSFQWTPRTGLL